MKPGPRVYSPLVATAAKGERGGWFYTTPTNNPLCPPYPPIHRGGQGGGLSFFPPSHACRAGTMLKKYSKAGGNQTTCEKVVTYDTL
jgi:hypothetical protein